MSRFHLDPFKLVYWVIAIATAQHTAWGAATTMQGAQPLDPIALAGWWAQGLAFAAGIDFLMVMVATKIRSGATVSIAWYRNWYVLTFTVVAIVSFYFQLVYAWQHATPLVTSGGVAEEWLIRLQGIINARIVIAPAALPLVATFYTLGGLGKGGEVKKPQSQSRNGLQSSQSRSNPIANELRIEREPLSQPTAPALSAGQTKAMERRGSEGELLGYICPGCGKALSVSGWSRHRGTCKQLQSLIVEYTNGHSPSSNGHSGGHE